MKKIIAIALATVAIAATALIAVPVFAREANPAPAVAQATPIVTTITPPTTSTLYTGYGSAFCSGGLALGDTVTLQRVAATLGITYDQLVTDLNNGQTIAAIAAAQKIDLSNVVDTVVAAQTDMVNVLVKYGYITQDQANTIIADLRTRVQAALSETPVTGYTGYGYGCFGLSASANGSGTYGYGMMGGVIVPPTTGSGTTPGTSYGYGMMGGLGRGMMGY